MMITKEEYERYLWRVSTILYITYNKLILVERKKAVDYIEDIYILNTRWINCKSQWLFSKIEKQVSRLFLVVERTTNYCESKAIN